MGTDESPELKSPLEGKPGNSAKPKPTDTMSTLNYSWNVRGTLNGNFVGASGTTASVDGVAEVHGTAGEGAPFDHSSWIWAGMAHYGLGWMKGGHKVNPCEKYPYHITSTGPSPGKDMPACTFSPVSPRASPTPSSFLFLRDSPSTANGGVRTALTGPPPTISDLKAPTLTRRSSWSATASRPAASCGGMATRTRAPGS